MTDAAPSPAEERRNVLVLATGQALFMTGQSMLIILSGLAGAMLSPDPALATLPVSATVVAAALSTVPASLLMRRVGRRAGFLTGAGFGCAGGAIAALGLWRGEFAVFVAGTFVLGVYGGFAVYYRFAAADAAREATRARAISWVVAGGVVAAVAGPQLARWTVDLLAPMTFLASYLTLAALPVAAMAAVAFLDLPPAADADVPGTARRLGRIARQPVFVVAVLGGMVGYGVMSLVMTATPLAMVGCGFGVGDAAGVIRWHVLAMFAPAFVTGHLIRRFGVLNVMLAGTALLGVCVAVALSGIELSHFTVALVALGLGWNFAFVGATTLLTEAYRPEERATVQAANDALVFGSVAAASLSSGALLHHLGWDAVQVFAAPLVAASALATAALAVARRRAARAPAHAVDSPPGT